MRGKIMRDTIVKAMVACSLAAHCHSVTLRNKNTLLLIIIKTHQQRR